MTSDALRIAVSGFPGTGKTSLVYALSQKFNIPIIQENMTDIAKAQTEYRLARTSGRGITPDKVGRLLDAFSSWDADRTRQYGVNSAFVADRWEADMLEVFLVGIGATDHRSDKIFSSLLRSFQTKAKLFDIVVVTPLLQPFTAESNETGLSRTLSLTSHVRNMALVLGLMQNFSSVPIFSLPNTPLSVDERVELIASHLEKNCADDAQTRKSVTVE